MKIPEMTLDELNSAAVILFIDLGKLQEQISKTQDVLKQVLDERERKLQEAASGAEKIQNPD